LHIKIINVIFVIYGMYPINAKYIV